MANQYRSGAIRVLECPRGEEYDEETFGYFLAMEQARAERSNHPLRLLLVSLEPVPGQPMPFPRAGAVRAFAALRLALRDTDVMGWYRQERVAGVVLTVPPGPAAAETVAPLERRVGEGLRRRLPETLARMVRVTVVQRSAGHEATTRGVR